MAGLPVFLVGATLAPNASEGNPPGILATNSHCQDSEAQLRTILK